MKTSLVFLAGLFLLSQAAFADCETMQLDLQPSSSAEFACQQMQMTGTASITSCDGKTAQLQLSKGGAFEMKATQEFWQFDGQTVDEEVGETITELVIIDLLSNKYQALRVTNDRRGHRRSIQACGGKIKYH